MPRNCFLSLVMALVVMDKTAILQVVAEENKYCPKSVETMEIVFRCPTTEKDKILRAKKKDCEQHAYKQNCTEPQNFKYHCVINPYRNASIEVCAAERRILGFCTEFNKGGGIIQAHQYLECVNFSPPCPRHYNSSSAYLYTKCYSYFQSSLESITTLTTDSPNTVFQLESTTLPRLDNTRSATNSSDVLIGSICVSVILTIFISSIVVIVIKRKKRTICKRRQSTKDPTKINSHVLQEEINDQEGKVSLLNEDIVEGGEITIAQDKTDNLTTTDKYSFATQKSMEDLCEENMEETKRYLASYKVIDKYFFETQMYHKAKECLEKNGILIITGPSGSGKTNTAIHLMLGLSAQNWTCRKIHTLDEFNFIKTDKKSLVFFDNIFHRNLQDYDLKRWWDKLEDIYKRYYQETNSARSHQQMLYLIFTARKNVIDRACTFMNYVTSLFHQNFRVDSTSLTDWEKVEVFKKQTEFAKREKNMPLPIVNEEFRTKLKESKGPIGFPLCAHLFACGEEYRIRGVKLFTHPIEFLKIQIQDEIESDQSNRTKTLFFVLFLFQWHISQLRKIGRFDKLEINHESDCRIFLNSISSDLIGKFRPLNFEELASVAQRLLGAFFIQETEGNFKFVHDSIYDAVGAYFCGNFFTETAKHFPLDIIKNQDYYNLSEKPMELLAERLICEIQNRKLSQVFSCRVFRNKTFVDVFCEELEKKDEDTKYSFFTVKNESSPVKLPCMFWLSHNSISYAAEKIYEIFKKLNIKDTDYHLYLYLYGECCSLYETLHKTINGMQRNNLEEIRKRVFEFQDADGNSILHLLILSRRSDKSASVAIGKLLDDGMHVDSKNEKKVTPLMYAVEQTLSRSHVIRTLIDHGAKQICKDIESSTVYHHCLRSENNDKTCTAYLELLLNCAEDRKNILSIKNARAETALNTAAKQTRYSRVCSILTILKYEEDMAKTINEEGFSPIHNTVKHLQGVSVLVKLECCIRVISFIRYGVDPKKLSNANISAVKLCRDTMVQDILEHPNDILVMENSLDNLLRNLPPSHCETDIVPDLTEKLGIELQCRIEQAVPHLIRADFEIVV